MKKRIWLMLIVVLALILAACQSATPTVEAPAETQAPAVETQAPGEVVATEAVQAEQGEAYPGPQTQAQQEQAAPAEGVSLYPGPEDGDMITLSQAGALLKNGEVTQVARGEGLEVRLTLRDGRTLTVVEPAEGDIVRLVERCGDACANTQVSQ